MVTFTVCKEQDCGFTYSVGIGGNVVTLTVCKEGRCVYIKCLGRGDNVVSFTVCGVGAVATFTVWGE